MQRALDGEEGEENDDGINCCRYLGALTSARARLLLLAAGMDPA